jgi:hypothetical protein
MVPSKTFPAQTTAASSMDSARSIGLYPPHRYSSGSGWCLTRHSRRRCCPSPPSASSRSRALPAVSRRLSRRSANASSKILSAATAQSSTTPLSGSSRRKQLGCLTNPLSGSSQVLALVHCRMLAHPAVVCADVRTTALVTALNSVTASTGTP